MVIIVERKMVKNCGGIYFPSKRSFRFLSNVGKSYIQGAKQLPKTGDVFLITNQKSDVGIRIRNSSYCTL